MEWLTSVNPTIWWFNYGVDLAFDNSIVTLHGQLRGEKLPTLSLCSAKVSSKAIHQGATAWFMMLHDLDVASLHRVEGTQDFSEAMHSQTIDFVTASKQKGLLTEYADVFEAPRKPAARAVDHRIELIDPMGTTTSSIVVQSIGRWVFCCKIYHQ